MTLGDALAPIPTDQFLQDYLGQRYLLLRGHAGRFHDLISWSDLDDALSRLRVSDNRVALVRNAKSLPPEEYVQRSKAGTVQYLNGPWVRKHVSDGATLVVNQVDELFWPVRGLTESCEALFKVYVSANLYAGWRTDKGFDVHWDSHDTLIFQIRGRKNWTVWAPTRDHPLPGEGRDRASAPTVPPVWEGTIEDGDVLYMPRGWWHVAVPRDEPSLHITFGVNHPTGVDLMTWAIDRMKNCVDTRRDIPHWRDEDERTRWLGTIREACMAALGDDAIESYMADAGERSHARPMVHLPRTAEETTSTPIDTRSLLRLVRGRQLFLRPVDGSSSLRFNARGTEWTCHEALGPALLLLNHLAPCTLADMQQKIDARVRPLLRPFINALAQADVIWVEPIVQEETTGVER